ncbi:MAG: hypothetical protein CVU73_02985 [Deltaproteobacteria bacterium HGW-Deltaproteobacteria-8]|jgi:hypothetical protein|nr:MAG: hypothetical protein CVU73_02985 [Deltaproteobacteria bacterium HGW-Deltaproteobacteria-8]
MHCKNLKTMLATLLCLGALATPALAQFNISIDLGVPPPRQRYEVVQEMRTGYVLIPGFWFWDGHQHRWSSQHWVEARPGHHWQQARWEQRGNRHHFEPGRWEPDRREDSREDRRDDRHDDRRDDRRDNHDQGRRDNPGRGHRDGNDRF